MTDRQTREVNIRVAKAERSRTNKQNDKTRMVQLPATAAIEYVAAGHFFPGGLLAGGTFGLGDFCPGGLSSRGAFVRGVFCPGGLLSGGLMPVPPKFAPSGLSVPSIVA